MKVSYGWVVVGAGMVMTCIGFGAMMALAVFLAPMAQQTGWSRSGISSVATIDFLFMGIGSILWGMLSDRIGYLTEHFKTHAKDHHSRRGLLKLVGQRRRLLDYLKKIDFQRYKTVIERLGIRK